MIKIYLPELVSEGVPLAKSIFDPLLSLLLRALVKGSTSGHHLIITVIKQSEPKRGFQIGSKKFQLVCSLR